MDSGWSDCHSNHDTLSEVLALIPYNNTSIHLIALLKFTVDGGWSDWSEYSACSATCGQGIQIATRECTNPAPEGSGQPCIGDTQAQRDCMIVECASMFINFFCLLIFGI